MSVCRAQNPTIDKYYQSQISNKISIGYSLINSNEVLAGINELEEAIAIAFKRMHDEDAMLLVLNSNSFITVVEYYYNTGSVLQAREYLDKHIQLCTRVQTLSNNIKDNFDYVDASYSIISGLASNNTDYLSSIRYTDLHKKYILAKEGYNERYFQLATYLIYEYIFNKQYADALKESILLFREKINFGVSLDEALRSPAEAILSIKARIDNNNQLNELISINLEWIDFLDQLYESYDQNTIDLILMAYDGRKSIEESIIYDQTSITSFATLMCNCTCELKLNGYDAACEKLNDFYTNLTDSEKVRLWPAVCFSFLATLEDLKMHSMVYRFCQTFENTIYTKGDFSDYQTYFYIYYFGACDRFGDYVKVFEILTNQFEQVPLESSLYWMISRLKGSMYMKFGFNEKALVSIKTALNSYRLPENPTASDIILYAGLVSYLGDAHRRCGNIDEAISEFEKSIKLCEQYNIPNQKLHSYFNLGRLYYDTNDYEKAKTYFMLCSEINRDYEVQLNTSSPYSYLFDIERRLGNISAATDYLRTTWNEKLKEYYSMKDFLTVYEQTQYWQFLGNIEFLGGLITESTPYYNHIYYDMLLASKGFLMNSEREEYLNVINSKDSHLIDLYNETHAVNYSNYEKIDEYMALYRAQAFKSQMEQISWSDVRSSLKKTDAAVELFKYCVYDSESDKSNLVEYYGALLIKADSDIPVFAQLCKTADVNTLLSYDSKMYSMNNLYDLIWKPLSSHLRGVKNIFISPQGELHKVNFSAIKDPKEKPLYMSYNIHRVSSTGNIRKDFRASITSSYLYGGLIYESSDSTMLAEHNKYGLSAHDQLWIKDYTRGGWNYLPNTQIEVERINEILKGQRIEVTKYEGYSGTEESFKHLSGKRPGIIHLATHGFYLETSSSISPEEALIRTGLILSNGGRAWNGDAIPAGIEDGILQADEISKLNLEGTSLLVLSACETALGEVSGDGIYGLQRAFKIAGVETIIMTLWEVNDEATSEFMINFYKYFMLNGDKYQAFRKAQEKLMKDYSDPYYWAAFIMLD
jgi:CHAT domain-containing protein